MTMIRSAIPDYFMKYKDEDVFRELQSTKDCFKHFDKNKFDFFLLIMATLCSTCQNHQVLYSGRKWPKILSYTNKQCHIGTNRII